MGKNISKATKKNSITAAEKNAAPAVKAESKPAAEPKKKGKKKGPQFRPGYEDKAKLSHTRGDKHTELKGVPVDTVISSRDTGAFGSVRIFGHSLGQVIRLLGKNGLTNGQIKAICKAIGLEAVRDSSIATWGAQGRTGNESVAYAPMSKEEVKKLIALAPKNEE